MSARSIGYSICLDCDGMGERIVYSLPKSFTLCESCDGQGSFPKCAGCGDPITGCIWTGGNCLDCHERGLLPMSAADLWDMEYAL